MTLPLETDCHAVKSRFDASDSLLLLDCREVDEFERARLDGALLIPMSEFTERMGELEAHRGQNIVVYCHHGVRSLRVTRYLREHGFERAQSLRGGIDAWSQQIDSAVPRY